MKTYAKNISNRKDLVKKLEQLTGQHAVYTFMPKCAYEIGAFTVNKDGTLTVQDDADSSIIESLNADGMIGEVITSEETKAEEPAETVSAAAAPARATVSESWDDEWEEDGTEEADTEEPIEESTAESEIDDEETEAEDTEELTVPAESEDIWDEADGEEAPAQTAPLKTSISFPLAQHTVQTLMNMH